MRTDLSQYTGEVVYTQALTEAAVQSVVVGCRKALEDGDLTKNDAAKLRGRAAWAICHSAGRRGRIGLDVF